MTNNSGNIGMKLIIGFAASCLILGILSQFKDMVSINEIAATDFTIIIAVVTLYTGFVILRKPKTDRQYVLLSLMKFWYGLAGHLIIMGAILYCCIYLNNTANYITRDILKTYKELEFSFKHFCIVLIGGISAGSFSVGFSYLINIALEKERPNED